MSCCLIFPGQGSQFVGMNEGLALNDAVTPELSRLMLDGPSGELDRTVNAQPAVLAVSMALLARGDLPEPAFVLGHSLGEYTALVAAGVVDASAALQLVQRRTAFMDAAQPDGSCLMAAVIGLDAGQVAEALSEVENVWPANFNGGTQVVIAGTKDGVGAAVEPLKAAGARKVLPLKVRVASHCPLMEPARQGLATYLETVELNQASVPVVCNASAGPVSDPARLKSLLADQLVSPVRFDESVRRVVAAGVDTFIEIGPKSVLSSLVKRIAPEAVVQTRTVR